MRSVGMAKIMEPQLDANALCEFEIQSRERFPASRAPMKLPTRRSIARAWPLPKSSRAISQPPSANGFRQQTSVCPQVTKGLARRRFDTMRVQVGENEVSEIRHVGRKCDASSGNRCFQTAYPVCFQPRMAWNSVCCEWAVRQLTDAKIPSTSIRLLKTRSGLRYGQ